MKHFSLVIVALVTATLSASAQQGLRTKPGRVLPAFIEVSAIAGTPSPDAALDAVQKQWGISPRITWVEESRRTDEAGFLRTTYGQLYNSYPIEGARLTVISKEGKLVRIAADVFEVNSRAGGPTVSEEAARTAAVAGVGAAKYLWEVDPVKVLPAYGEARSLPKGTLCWAPKAGDVRTTPEWHLCYRFDVYAVAPHSRHWMYVDATTGEVVWKRSRIADGSSVGTGVTLYSGNRSMITDSLSPTLFNLYDATRGGGVYTYDMNEGTDPMWAVEFSDADNFWNTTTNLDKAANDVHWGTEVVYDYYDTAHNWHSYDNANSPLLSFVHFYEDFANAFWDGTAMYYGDGDGVTFNPLVSMDIVAHELTHGVTEHTAALDYAYESGALNESFSDIFGNTVERLAKPGDWNWKLGEEIGTTSSAYIRSMSNPNAKGHPDTYSGTNWYSGTLDNGGVHINSGVQNFWYYILVEGDTGTNDFGSAYSIPGLGLDKAKDIAFRALSVYLSPFSQYADARDAAIAAAADLFGGCSPEVEQTTNAWYAVGVGAPYSPAGGSPVAFSADVTSHCTVPATVNFTHTTSNVASQTWYFGDGGTSTVSTPSHTYTAAGSYTVKLVVTYCTGAKDSLQIPGFISATAGSKFCDTTVMPISGEVTSTSCNGIVVDNGGTFANYSSDVYAAVKLQPAGATGLRLRFVSFNTEAGYDYLYIFDGSGATFLGAYDGSTLPASGGYITLPTPDAYIVFISDDSIEETGFVMEYECTKPAPVPAFSTTETIDCDGAVSFTNATLPAASTNVYTWYFGDGETSTAVSPTHTYTMPGTYDVTLVACESGFCDTLTRFAYVNTLALSPLTSIPDTVAISVPFGVSASTPSPAIFAWYIDGNGPISGASTSLSCATTGLHEVMLISTSGSCTDTVRESVWARDPARISSIDPSPIILFPNPASEFVEVRMHGVAGEVLGSLRNAAGQMVWTGRLHPVHGARIPVAGLPNGVYALTLQTTAGTQTARVVVHHR